VYQKFDEQCQLLGNQLGIGNQHPHQGIADWQATHPDPLTTHT